MIPTPRSSNPPIPNSPNSPNSLPLLADIPTCPTHVTARPVAPYKAAYLLYSPSLPPSLATIVLSKSLSARVPVSTGDMYPVCTYCTLYPPRLHTVRYSTHCHTRLRPLPADLHVPKNTVLVPTPHVPCVRLNSKVMNENDGVGTVERSSGNG